MRFTSWQFIHDFGLEFSAIKLVLSVFRKMFFEVIFAKLFCYEGIAKERRYIGEVFLPIHVLRLMKCRIARNDVFQGLSS